MGKLKGENLRNIQRIFEEKTGTNIREEGRERGGFLRKKHMMRIAASAAALLSFVTLSAFTYAKLTQIGEDSIGFAASYKGEGVIEVRVKNDSDKDLKLENQVKLQRWSTGEDVAGAVGKIRMDARTIKSGAEGIVTVDLSDAYDMKELEKPLEEGDWYYLILTNNSFAFGQDWRCSVDFDGQRQPAVLWAQEQRETVQKVDGRSSEMNRTEGVLAQDSWEWPTESRVISLGFGIQENGSLSEHVSIAGEKGDVIYAVADGKIKDTGFDAELGNYVVLELTDGTEVTYGHLQDIALLAGEDIEKGQKLGTLGKTGMATGTNLYFAVKKDGEPVNPIKSLPDEE